MLAGVVRPEVVAGSAISDRFLAASSARLANNFNRLINCLCCNFSTFTLFNSWLQSYACSTL